MWMARAGTAEDRSVVKNNVKSGCRLLSKRPTMFINQSYALYS